MNNHFEDDGQFSEIWQRPLESSWRRYSLVKLMQVIQLVIQFSKVFSRFEKRNLRSSRNDYSTIILSFVSIILKKFRYNRVSIFVLCWKKKISVTSEQFLSSRFSLLVSRQTDFVQTSENRWRRVETYRWNVVRGERKGRGDGAEGCQAIGRELSITGVFRDEKLHREQKRG